MAYYIENDVANKILKDAKKGKNLQLFMDVVSGIGGYKINNHRRQGYIRGAFVKELIAGQFLVEFDDIISVFWHGVFEHLDNTRFFGENVEVRTSKDQIIIRPTNNNPVNYLRYHGKMAVRNYLSGLYRKNLEQGCSVCGHSSSARSNKQCPVCGSIMSTTYKFSDVDMKHDNLLYNNLSKETEDKEVISKIYKLLDEFAEDELKAGTRAYQILKILVYPNESAKMCKDCGLCDTKVFDIDSCTNYNANIGRWLGVNKTMIASKIRRIRDALPRWLAENKSNEAGYLLDIIPSRFKALLG